MLNLTTASITFHVLGTPLAMAAFIISSVQSIVNL
jgi:hypothetical protein